jgi:hypothetical protein
LFSSGDVDALTPNKEPAPSKFLPSPWVTVETVIVSPALVESNFNPLYVDGLLPFEKSGEAEATTAGPEAPAEVIALFIIVATPLPFTVSCAAKAFIVAPPKAMLPLPVKDTLTELVPSEIVICTGLPELRVAFGTIASPKLSELSLEVVSAEELKEEAVT